MKRQCRARALVALGLLLVLTVGTTHAQGPEGRQPVEVAGGPPMTDSFTYQGQLMESGQPAYGYYDFDITIWDAETLGTEIASCTTLAQDNVYVEDGMFAFNLQPDEPTSEVFNGDGRWIQVQVREHGAGAWTTLPRQPITAAPYAWSLRPGANISGTSDDAILSVNNYGDGHGIWGYTLNGYAGVYGESSTWYGVWGQGARFGVFGLTFEEGGQGVRGRNGSETGTTYGVYGEAASPDGYGGYFYNSDADLYGGIAVAGMLPDHSRSDVPIDYFGYFRPAGLFGGPNGVIGFTNESYGHGVQGLNQTSDATGWAGWFDADTGNGVYITTPAQQTGLTVSGGSKNAAVGTQDGARLLYSEESTEVWFTDYGFGQLVDGQATVEIDRLFAQTVNLSEPYHVFIQVYGDAEVYVSDRTPANFEVRLREGVSDVEFSYRIVARRLGYEGVRLERAPWADNDPHLYPEKASSGWWQGAGSETPGGQP